MRNIEKVEMQYFELDSNGNQVISSDISPLRTLQVLINKVNEMVDVINSLTKEDK